MANHPAYLPMYRALVEYAQDLLGVIDLNGRIRHLSPSGQEVMQTKPAQWMDRALATFCHVEDMSTLAAWLKRLQISDDRQLCSVQLGQEGRWRLIQLSGVRIHEDEYQQVIVISGHDVTVEVEATRALKTSEQRYHGAFDYSPIGKALLASDGHITESNRALADMMGCWPSQILGSNLFEHFSKEDAEQLHQDAAQLVARRDESRERELLLQRDGQSPRWLLLNMAPIWNEGGRLEHFIVQIQDFSARRRAEQDLRDSNADLLRTNEELKRFAFVASHDLREPLRGIGGSIQLIERRYREALGDEGQELAQQAVQGVKRLQALLNELVTYAEQMRGGALERQTVVVSRVIQDIGEEFAAQMEALGAKLQFADLPSILGDPEQIRLIFWHLIDNALKFSAPQRALKIEISARWAQGLWQFCVADNGIGIAPEHQQQIFDVFRRLHPDTPGTGMGLATVRKMIERHGGKIWVESSAGSGARFHFSLPPE